MGAGSPRHPRVLNPPYVNRPDARSPPSTSPQPSPTSSRRCGTPSPPRPSTPGASRPSFRNTSPPSPATGRAGPRPAGHPWVLALVLVVGCWGRLGAVGDRWGLSLVPVGGFWGGQPRGACPYLLCLGAGGGPQGAGPLWLGAGGAQQRPYRGCGAHPDPCGWVLGGDLWVLAFVPMAGAKGGAPGCSPASLQLGAGGWGTSGC